GRRRRGFAVPGGRGLHHRGAGAAARLTAYKPKIQTFTASIRFATFVHGAQQRHQRKESNDQLGHPGRRHHVGDRHPPGRRVHHASGRRLRHPMR
ncbi:hypothetical protein SB782_32455, partial [Brevibacillus sp. SIMBA_076]|uniref:hypothetical protein n=1 Tax=Brevibacillus sp. SIMBA_076 TaxID=3085814 RepID=UPI00397D7CBE